MIKNYNQLLTQMKKVISLEDSLNKEDGSSLSQASKKQVKALIIELKEEIDDYYKKGIFNNNGIISLSDDMFKLFLHLGRTHQKGRGVYSNKIRTKKKIVKKQIESILRSYIESHK